MAENKVRFGIKNVHYAVITEGADNTYTYGTPVKFPGATALTLTPKGESVDFYADDMLYYTASSNLGYDGTVTVANITESFRKDVLGELLETVDKVLTETNKAIPKKIALLFEFDGDAKGTRHVLYSCTVSRPGTNSTTKTATHEVGTTELNIVASPRPEDGVVKRSTTAETTATIYDAWYTAVYEPVGA